MEKDQKKLLQFGIVFMFFVIAGVLLWKFKLVEPTVSPSPLTANPLTYDFGEISMAKGNVVTAFTLKNEGTKALKINGVQTSCMCTTAEIDGTSFGMHNPPPANITLNGGETKEMKVTFDPNAHGPEATGPISRIISIRTNSTKTPVLEIRFSGNVTK